MRNWVLKSFVVAILVIGFAGIEGCGQDASLTIDLRPTPAPASPTVAPTLAPSPTPSAGVTATPTSTPRQLRRPRLRLGLLGSGADWNRPRQNVGYVPIYPLDAKGNAQIAVVDLTVGKANPVIKELSLDGTQQPLAVAYNPNNKTMLAEARKSSDNSVALYESTPRPSGDQYGGGHRAEPMGTGGGIVENAVTNKAFVAGSDDLGILDTSTSPPVWDPTSVVTAPFMDSFSVNSTTGIMFIASDGTNSIVDTTKSPLAPQPFTAFATDDGNGFDIATNIALVSQEVVRIPLWR